MLLKQSQRGEQAQRAPEHTGFQSQLNLLVL